VVEEEALVSNAYPHVFRPIQLGPVPIRNRFYFSPHGIPLNLGPVPTDDCAYYFAERAAGGCGLVMHSLQAFPAGHFLASPHSEDTIPSFEAVARAVHDHDTRIFGQLHYHCGVPSTWGSMTPPGPSLAPSIAQHFDAYVVTREMEIAEIGRLVDAYRQSASNLRKAGYDGIEVHCTHGASLEQFL
jgi:2,4-dienoyl-CoA reductase (NADPH2)